MNKENRFLLIVGKVNEIQEKKCYCGNIFETNINRYFCSKSCKQINKNKNKRINRVFQKHFN